MRRAEEEREESAKMAMTDKKLKPATDTQAEENFSVNSKSTRTTANNKLQEIAGTIPEEVIAMKWHSGPFAPCTRLASYEPFENFILIIIVLNALWIGIDMELNRPGKLYIVENTFELFSFVEGVFCVIFSFELTIRWFQYKLPIYFFIDPTMFHWNIFDFSLVAMMIFETWIVQSPMAPFDVEKHRKANEAGEEGGGSSLAQFRMLRLLRISRMVRVLRMVPELGMMVKSLVAATRGVASTMLLAILTIYVYGVVFAQWAKAYEGDDRDKIFAHYGHLFNGMLTFFQVMVYDDAFAVVRDTFNASVTYGILIIIFVLIGAFTILNMLVGVIVEIVQDTQTQEQEFMLLQKVADAFYELDKDGSGVVTREEFEADLGVIEACGIDPHTVQLAMELMEEEKGVDLLDFVDLIFKLLRPISSLDIVQLSLGVARLCKLHGAEPSPAVVTMDIRKVDDHGDMMKEHDSPKKPSASADASAMMARELGLAERKRYRKAHNLDESKAPTGRFYDQPNKLISNDNMYANGPGGNSPTLSNMQAVMAKRNGGNDNNFEEANMAMMGGKKPKQAWGNDTPTGGAEITSDTDTAMIPVSSMGTESNQSAYVDGAPETGAVALNDEDGAKAAAQSPDEISAGMLIPAPNFFSYHCRVEWFPNTILGIICINALWIGLEIEFNDDPDKDWGNGVFGVGPGHDLHGVSAWVLGEHIFCIIFTYEMVVRIFAYKKFKFFFTDPCMWYWNLFDGVLVTLMIFENWVILLMGGGSMDMSTFSIFRILRLARLTRIIRNVPELATMVKSLGAAARSVGSTMALLMGLIYVFAIIFTQWGKEVEGEAADEIYHCYFGQIGISSLTLLQLMVFDDAVGIVRVILDKDLFMGLVLVIFMCMGSFTVLNMLIGVICEIVSATKAEEEERIMRAQCKELFKEFDADLSGTISWEEYESRKDLITAIGLSPDTCRMAFELGDRDGTGCLALNEFIGMCFKLVKPPEAHDLLLIKRNLRKTAMTMHDKELVQMFSRTNSQSNMEAGNAAVQIDEVEETLQLGRQDSPQLPGAIPITIEDQGTPKARK